MFVLFPATTRNDNKSIVRFANAVMLGVIQFGIFSAPLLANAETDFSAVSEWPKIVGEAENTLCQRVLAAARSAFFSKQDYVTNATEAVLSKKGSGLIFGPASKFNPSDDGPPIYFDTDSFSRVEVPQPTTCFVQHPISGIRVLIMSVLFREAEIYGVYALEGDIDSRSVVEAAIAHDHGGSEMSIANVTALLPFSVNWQVPLIFFDAASNKTAFVDTGHPEDRLADWNVYDAAAANKPVCLVRFRDPKTIDEDGSDIFSNPTFRQFAALLARISQETRSWANALYRPWSTVTPYNTREEVDRSLKSWSGRGPENLKEYNLLRELYPKLVAALASHYKRNFQLSQHEAKKLAQTWGDLLYRSYFTFSKFPNRQV